MEKTEPISYTVKTITFMKRRVPIMMQNQNGPCPLLALANILLLRNQIQLSPDAPSITQARHFLSLFSHRTAQVHKVVSKTYIGSTCGFSRGSCATFAAVIGCLIKLLGCLTSTSMLLIKTMQYKNALFVSKLQ